jgi:hypothetical protein
MARQYLRITPETTYGTYASGNTHTVIQLDQSNPFTMRPMPIFWSIRTAGGFNGRWQKGSAKTSLGGNLNTICYGSQMAAFVPLISATTGNVLKSFTIDHAIVMDDSGSTTVYRRYLGVMCQQAQITASEQNQLMRMSLQLIGQQPATITGTDFPEPAATAYPIDAPYVFEQVSGAFTLGSSRAELEEFNLTIKNYLDPRFMASQYLTRCKYCGRDVDFSTRFPYIVTVDRSDLESVTAVAASAAFTNGAHTLTFQMNSNNFYAKVDDDLALDKVHLQSVDMECYFDTTAGTPFDFVLTAT